MAARIVLLLLLFSLFVCHTEPALGYPSNTRFGYANCQSCHISPTGGGVLTPYGKSTAEEFLSTWAFEGEANYIYDTELMNKLHIGGDVRYMSVFDIDNNANINFPMQADIEIAYNLTPNVIIDVAGGLYGKDQKIQSRRNYILINANRYFSLRAGRFFPAYGILIPDHTALIRRGLVWEQGGETYNAELSVKAPFGELFFTRIFGRETEVKLTGDVGYRYKLVSDRAVAVRAAVYLGKTSQIGGSVYVLEESLEPGIMGLYSMIGIGSSSWILAQADYKNIGTDKNYVGYLRYGYEPVKGLHLLSTLQYKGDFDNNFTIGGLGVTWFPRPHLELGAEYLFRKSEFVNSQGANLMLHYYL